MKATISSLHIYPVKSCKGIDLKQAEVTRTGLKYDRQWMVVNPQGTFMTQRTHSKMALIETSLPPECLTMEWEPTDDACLLLRAPGQEPLAVRLTAMHEADPKTRQISKVWNWTGPTHYEGDAAADWLTRFLGTPARLVRYAGSVSRSSGDAYSDPLRRGTDPEFAPGSETAFADGFPLLVTSEASRAAVEMASGEAVPMNRFRPNIVVTGGAAFEEDSWVTFQTGAALGSDTTPITLNSVKPCSRCKTTTVNQSTAAAGKQPLQALQEIRSGEVLAEDQKQFQDHPNWKKAAFFGVNATADQDGCVSVGDQIEVVSTLDG